MQDETTSPEVQPETVTESTIEKAVDEAIAEAPAKAFWGVRIDWKEGASDDERAQAEILLLPLIRETADSPEDHLPFCVEAVTIRRIHD